ncbi:MAG: hypothetical protein LBI06_02355 [Treponema sp.]|nr:hypothetical protein [Treponema sp.]
MSTYALDANIISFYLKGNTSVIDNIEKAISEDHSIVIAPIAYYEVKRGLMMINAVKQMRKLEILCNLFPVGELGDYLLEESIKIYVQERKAKRNTEDADIFIAAFCIHNDCMRRVHTPPFRAFKKGMYPETNTLPKQHTPSLQGGVVDFILVTDNVKHFQNIADLRLVNWKMAIKSE